MNTHEALLFNVLSSLPIFIGILAGELLLHTIPKDPGCLELDPEFIAIHSCNDPEQVIFNSVAHILRRQYCTDFF
jgi:hypothetical protein